MSTTPTFDQSLAIGFARDYIYEAFIGPQQTQYTWFIGQQSDSALLPCIQTLNARQASKVLPGMSRSIAAHVEHLRWHLDNVNHTMKGNPWQADWSQSWSVQVVDDAAWEKLQADVRRETDELVATLEKPVPPLDRVALQGLLAIGAHAAHHLGSIRILARLV
jgi:hypothetical protein